MPNAASRSFLNKCRRGPSSQSCRKSVYYYPDETYVYDRRGNTREPQNGSMTKRNLSIKGGRTTGKIVSKTKSERAMDRYNSPHSKLREWNEAARRALGNRVQGDDDDGDVDHLQGDYDDDASDDDMGSAILADMTPQQKDELVASIRQRFSDISQHTSVPVAMNRVNVNARFMVNTMKGHVYQKTASSPNPHVGRHYRDITTQILIQLGYFQ